MEQQYYGFDEGMFAGSQRVDFHSFKNGEHKFRVLPPFAKGKLFVQVDLHWGFTDENGKKKALKCTKWSHKTCAICDEVEKLKGEVELLKASPASTPQQVEELKSMIETKEKRISDIKRKPTYLWNIMTDNGEQKVLQLSWNGHDPLHQKVKFFWEQKKINVTDPRANYLIWVSRTGQNAKTRYQYEVLEQNVRQLEGLKPLIDLDKVYKETTPAELKAIVEAGYVGVPEEDPNDRDFSASMPTADEIKNQQTTTHTTTTVHQGPAGDATLNLPAGHTVNQQALQNQSQQAPANNSLNSTNQAAVDDETARLMSMLNS